MMAWIPHAKTPSSPLVQSAGRAVLAAALACWMGVSACGGSDQERQDPQPSEKPNASNPSEEPSDLSPKKSDTPQPSPEVTPSPKEPESPETSTTGDSEPTNEDDDDKDKSGEDTQEPEEDSDSDSDSEKPKEDGEPVECAGNSPKVVLNTSMGKIVLQLDGEAAPITVANFIQYVNDKFYDQTIFHRVVDGFVIQGGGHGTDGKLKETRPPIKLEKNTKIPHVDGTISMARTDVEDSANSQFFICDGNTQCKRLDGQYASFGKTIEGLQVVHEISGVRTSGSGSKPVENVVVESAFCVN